jgi:hypothetical protein
MRYSDCLLDIGENFTMHKSGIAALLTGCCSFFSFLFRVLYGGTRPLTSRGLPQGDLKWGQDLLHKGDDANAKWTGGEITIPALRLPGFAPAKALRDICRLIQFEMRKRRCKANHLNGRES